MRVPDEGGAAKDGRARRRARLGGTPTGLKGHVGAHRRQRSGAPLRAIACMRVHVLLTNDDGIEAAGLQALRRALTALDSVSSWR